MPRTTAGQRQVVRNFGTCLDFRTAGSRVTVADSASLRLTSSLTISVWINPISFGTGGTARILSKIPSTAGYQVLMLNNSSQGTFRLSEFGGNYDASNNAIKLKQWQHLAITFDKTLSSNQIKFYINGINVGNATKTTDIATDTSNLTIGDQEAGGRVFDGWIDDLRIYNRGLSASEVANLYYGSEPSSSGLVLWHKYDEGAGTSAIDSSGNQSAATITNATYSITTIL